MSTPGPWKFVFDALENGDPFVRIYSEYGHYDRGSHSGFDVSGIASEADGRLIAAAPDMLETLYRIRELGVELAQRGNPLPAHLVALIATVIAKAAHA